MKILLVAFALGPTRGSEPATGWGWASSLARIHEVTVVSQTRNQEEVDRYLMDHPELKLRIYWVPSRRRRGGMTYLSWLNRVVALCGSLVAREKFDVVHLVTFGTISAPVDLWKLGIPFVLGPVGGGQRLNPIYQEVLGSMPLGERLRNLRVGLLPYLPAIRRTVQRAALVLATNRETECVARRCGGKTLLFGDTGIRDEFLLGESPVRQSGTGLGMLWTGRMQYIKGIPLALRAMKVAARKDLTLDLLGAGPMESGLRALVSELGLQEQVNFHGQVPFARVFDFYDKADLFVFPSVRDSFGSQLLEAASRGLPILTLNHQGAGALVPDAVAWKVPVDTVNSTINGMAEAMVELADNPEKLAAMSKAAIAYAHTESWSRRAERMSELYERLHSTTTAEIGFAGGTCRP
ncbi:MAG: glycosyltransferase family 4 protein [Terracidiphilus sp.]